MTEPLDAGGEDPGLSAIGAAVSVADASTATLLVKKDVSSDIRNRPLAYPSRNVAKGRIPGLPGQPL